MISGTSTGGILSLFLLCSNEKGKAKYTAKEAVENYLEHGPKIFKKSTDTPKKLLSISAMYCLFEKIASTHFSDKLNPAGFQYIASIPTAFAAAPPPER